MAEIKSQHRKCREKVSENKHRETILGSRHEMMLRLSYHIPRTDHHFFSER